MRQIALVVLGLCLSALSAQVASAADSATGRGVAKYVVIIGVDGVIGNAVGNRTADRQLTYIGDPELPKDKAIRCPMLYNAAHDSGLKTICNIDVAPTAAHLLGIDLPSAEGRVLTEILVK